MASSDEEELTDHDEKNTSNLNSNSSSHNNQNVLLPPAAQVTFPLPTASFYQEYMKCRMFEKAYEARKQHNEEIAKLNAAATASFAMVPAVSQAAKPMSKAFKPSTKEISFGSCIYSID